MNKLKIAIQCGSLGQRCGIYTYSDRLNNYLNKQEDVESTMFVNKIRGNPDVISIQYEPGMCNPQQLQDIIHRYPQPIIVTAHHIGYLPQFYPIIDGIVLHSKDQVDEKPWDYKVIPHPALVFPKKDKKKLREKYGLPKDKKIMGTAGFICGTGKILPDMTKHLLENLKDDEFLYYITSFWKGGDMGRLEQIKEVVKSLGKEKQFRIDTDFVSEETLNEKMQCCDLLFAWNAIEQKGSTSGIAMDMIGSRTKLIVKDSHHYGFVGNIDGVEVGRQKQDEFAEDVLKLLRKGDLKNIPDPTPYSWDALIREYVEYFKEIGE